MVRAGIISYSNVLLEKYAKYALDSLETNKQKKSFQKSSRAIKKKKKNRQSKFCELAVRKQKFQNLTVTGTFVEFGRKRRRYKWVDHVTQENKSNRTSRIVYDSVILSSQGYLFQWLWCLDYRWYLGFTVSFATFLRKITYIIALSNNKEYSKE